MLCLLGPLAVLDERSLRPLTLRPKAVALLAYLALSDTPVARRDLGRLLSPEAEDPRAALRWHLNSLRSELPETVRQGFQIGRDSVHLDGPTDVVTFRQGARRVTERPDSPDAREILNLYRGDLCADLAVSASAAFDSWFYAEQEALRGLFRQATHSFARWALAGGRPQDAVDPLGKLVSLEPYFEDAHILLIETYESLGQHDAASGAYQRYQRIMRKELQVEPRPSVARRFERDPPSGPTLPLEDLVPLRDVTIHLVEWPGDEPTIVAIHGSAGSAYGLAALGERLAPDIRFIAFDLRGHGFSDKPPAGYGLDHHVEDTIELLKRLRLKRPVLLGFSAGGTIAAFIAARIAVQALILLDGVIGDRAFTANAAQVVPLFGHRLGMRFKSLEEYAAATRRTRRPYSAGAEAMFDRFVPYELARLPDGSFQQRARRVALEEEWASMAEADSLRALAEVRCPVLIVHAPQPFIGGRPYLTEEIIAAQLQAARSAQLFVAGRSNHAELVRDPEPELIECIRRFVRP
jgi:pimeloyl-ACP methyl ester carboxylesterase/DNA-binding SARP family transcriptional activator